MLDRLGLKIKWLDCLVVFHHVIIQAELLVTEKRKRFPQTNIQLIESFSSSCGLDFHNISIDFLFKIAIRLYA